MPFNVQCKRCFHLQNEWCKQKLDSPDPDAMRNCLYYKEATNADRIRAMSDEELAKWGSEITRCDYCPAKPCKSLFHCETQWLAWLQSPADGGDHDA